MPPSRRSSAVAAYAAALDELEQAEKPEPLPVLAALAARDTVARALSAGQIDKAADLQAIIRHDARLRQMAAAIIAAVKLSDWRGDLCPPTGSWWWHLETEATLAPASRHDWIWSAAAVTLLIASLSLMAEITRRFLSGGVDAFGAFATLFQTVVALIAGGGALTEGGRREIERLLPRLKLRRGFRRLSMLLLFAALLTAPVALWFALPSIAGLYHEQGFDHYQAGELTSAMHDLRRAISLCPDLAPAHYTLGRVHEALLDTDNAQAEYRIAVAGNLDAAYNDLARLYIRQGDLDEACHLLQLGIEKRPRDRAVLYVMYKNLGWARVEQKRYAEAAASLKKAIELDPAPAAAHCLLAQAEEGLGNVPVAACQWNECLKTGRASASLEEDTWIGLAHQFFSEYASLPVSGCSTGGQP